MSRIQLSLFALALVGCPSTSEDEPTDLSTTGDESTGSATLTTSVTSVDTTATTSPETTADSTDTTEGPDDTTTTGGPECLGENDCWNCAPTNSNQLLDHCTDAECSPFDNVARLPLLNRDGTLPALP
ncbi:MAG TPA: hypothetical protein VG755_16960 [Nannocystaceae bacterium]|nr:hypothetical protein [Nannocystaceae bacterium]